MSGREEQRVESWDAESLEEKKLEKVMEREETVQHPGEL